MSDKKKAIYIVASGSYSEYTIDGVFSTREKAGQFAHVVPDGNVEEHEVDPAGARKTPLWWVTMDREGDNAEACKQTPDTEPEKPIAYVDGGGHPTFDCYVSARDETQAIKAGNEKRARFIAAGKWPKEVGG